MLQQDDFYIQRCLQLAKLGAGNVAPNPMVGAILVFDDTIIGEGYHKEYGKAHAEVNCINSVRDEQKHLIGKSTLYVSLEPCAHFGKTPPCSDLIIKNKIPKVVIGCRDPFKKVNGRGIEKLKAAGIEVVTNVLKDECIELNKRFFTFHEKQRPYVILKWAQTADKKIASTDNKRLIISNEITNRLVHRWRSEEAAILVGTNTALFDDPQLTNRLWSGKNPVRLVIDKDLKLSNDIKVFTNEASTIVFNLNKSMVDLNGNLINKVYYYRIENKKSLVQQIIQACYQLNIQSIFVEGGKKLLQSFIDEELFDEIRIITNQEMMIEKGLESPEFFNKKLNVSFSLSNDLIQYYG